MGVDFIVIHRTVNGVRETIIYCGPVVEGSGGLGQRGAGGKDLGHRLPPVEFPKTSSKLSPRQRLSAHWFAPANAPTGISRP